MGAWRSIEAVGSQGFYRSPTCRGPWRVFHDVRIHRLTSFIYHECDDGARLDLTGSPHASRQFGVDRPDDMRSGPGR